MKKASFVSLVLLVLTANSLVLAQPAKVLLLEPETEKVPYSLACDVYAWMGEDFGKYKDYISLVDLKQARESLSVKNIYLSKCKVNSDYFKVGDLLHLDEIVFTRLVSKDFQYIYSVMVFGIKNKSIIYQKETSKNITYKSDIYDLVTESTKKMIDSIYIYHLNSAENNTANAGETSDTVTYVGKGQFREMEKTPELVKKTVPIYPSEAKLNGIQGKVILYLLIGKNGMVKQVDIAKTSGSVLLDEAAKDAARQFIFTPALAPGKKPVRVWVMYPVNFKLE